MNELELVLDKYFGDERVKYYMTADVISNDQYIKWDYCRHERKRIVISVGSNEGEVEVKLFGEGDAEKLEQFIKILIY